VQKMKVIISTTLFMMCIRFSFSSDVGTPLDYMLFKMHTHIQYAEC